MASLLVPFLVSSGSVSPSRFTFAARAAKAITAGRVHIQPNFLSATELDQAQAAVAELQALHGHGKAAVVGGTTLDRRVRDTLALDLLTDAVWRTLPLPLLQLVGVIDSMRSVLATECKRPLDGNAELQLLHYHPGGFYARHVDDGIGTAERPVRRSISLLLYLTPTDWHAERDGGCLRVFERERAPRDLPPTAGTLVLFDSASVPHEVMATHRERRVLVGWLCEQRATGETSETKLIKEQARAG